MTETERLRELLDERGVKWRAWDGVHPITVWHDEQCVYEYMERTLLDGVKPHTGEVVDGTGRLEAVIHVCSPEQAIAATLGRGTCHPIISDNLNESEGTGDAWADCSECGHLLFVLTDTNSQPPNFCPNCGRKVVDA